MSDAPPQVSVIIAAYHSADLLPRCLDSLEAQVFRDFEAIVVNSSPEARTAEVMSRHPRIRFRQHPERLLPHAARNVGVSLAHGRLLVFTDADCRAEPDWLAALIACHAAGHELVGGGIETSAAAAISRAIHLLKYSSWLRGRPAGPLELAATGNMLVSRDAWERAGPFDGSLYAGDSLLCMRARRAGIIPWFEPRAVVIDQDEALPRGFFRERFRRGREFGAMRARFEGWPRPRLLLRTVLAPLAVLSALSRMAAACRAAGRLRAFAASLPFQAAAQAAWCAGEACGYAATMLRGGSRSDAVR